MCVGCDVGDRDDAYLPMIYLIHCTLHNRTIR